MREVSAIFGRQFADALSDLELQSWQGPVESSYGLHLVFVDAHVPARVPVLEAIRARVRAELLAERQTKTDGALYGKLRERYEIVVERPQARPLTAE